VKTPAGIPRAPVWRRLAAALGTPCLLLAAPAHLYAQGAVQIERWRQPVDVSPDLDDRQSPPVTTQTPQVDERGLWFHLRRANLPMVRLEIERLQRQHPGWEPGGDLARAMERLVASGATPPLATERPAAAPAQPQPCADPVAAWRNAAQSTAGQEMLRRMLSQCNDSGIAEGSLARLLEGRPLGQRLAETEALQALRLPPRVAPVVNREIYRQRLAAAAAQGEDAALLTPPRQQALEQEARAREDGDAALTLGWRAMGAGDGDSALTWFEAASHWGQPAPARDGLAAAYALRARDALDQGQTAAGLEAIRQSRAAGGNPAETLAWAQFDAGRWTAAEQIFQRVDDPELSAYGRALSLRGAGRNAEARALACAEAQTSARLKTTCVELLEAEIVAASQAGDSATTLAQGSALEAIAPLSAGIAEILAWTQLQQGDYASAAERFGQLVQPDMRPELASGVIQSYAGAGREAELPALAASNPPLAQALLDRSRRLAWQRQQFDLYERLGGTTDTGEAPGRQTWALSAGYSRTFSPSGTAGQDKTDLQHRYLSLSGALGPLRLELGLRDTDFDAGHPGAGTDIGLRSSPPSAAETAAALGNAGNSEVLLRARLEQPGLTLQGSLGTRPRQGQVSTPPTYSLAMTRYTEQGSLFAELRRAPRNDSLLAYSGARDPVSGRSWGGVSETRLLLRPYIGITDSSGISVGIEHAWLEGRHVPDNQRNALRLDYSHELRLEDWEYFRVGPFVSTQRYQRNLGHYTYGHGGYYSPQRDWRAGLQLDALSREGAPWLVHTQAAVAYADAREGKAARYPGTAIAGPDYATSTSHGAATDLRLRAGWQLASQLIVTGQLGLSDAPEYRRWTVGVGVTIPFEKRRGVFSTDLRSVFDNAD